MVAVLAAYGFARFIGMGAAFLESGFYTYNPLLVGLSLGYLFKLTPQLPVLPA
jgi:urea transporter